MPDTIFDKTDKGREEISKRTHHLAPRLRTLLLLLDGKSSAGQVLQKVAGLGLDASAITELLAHEFIRTVTPAPLPPDPPELDIRLHPEEQTLLPAAPAAGGSQFEAIYTFYNATIKSTMGLRGFALQLKVERASTIDDFRALRETYVAAVLKARGPDMARSLGDRLDTLLRG